MKIIVYAISKNESKFVDRWYNSMKEADSIYVLDTGSTDNTVELLKEKGINVKIKKYDEWRFDKARNDSLNLVPLDADICVCTDLDEVFTTGWRNKLEKVWKKEASRCEYTYNWLIENNTPKISFISDKIHSRKNYKWIHAVHEVLKCTNNSEFRVKDEEIIINHYPDNNKSRSTYLPLLELSVKEEPFNDRNMHYLGREYMYYKEYNKAIDTLINHLNLNTAVWRDERCASMRFIARSYKYLKRFKESEMWYKLAIKEAPYLRDPYVELALLYYELNNWKKVEYYIRKALKIQTHQKTYINEIFSWNETPYDLLSLSCFYQNKYRASLKYINIALSINNSQRLLNNKIIILNKYLKK